MKTLSIAQNLIVEDDIVGVACSGGRDSMALLHYLHTLSTRVGFSVFAINIDHSIRSNSADDSLFVINYCQKNNIQIQSFKVDVPSLCQKEKLSLEQGARKARYDIFNTLLKNKTVTKVALGHHLQDQAETILLNIFRGTGLKGASGMRVKNGRFIRPMLNTSRTEIQAYIVANNVPFVDDQTNFENNHSRNYIRNMIMPLVRNRWQNSDKAIASFGKICAEDDAYINSHITQHSILINGQTAKIPTNYLVVKNSLSSRFITYALKKIGIKQNIERKHILAISKLAATGENGSRINLPNKLLAIKEYNYLTLTNKSVAAISLQLPFSKGVHNIPNFGVLEIQLTRKLNSTNYTHMVDHKKLPKNAVWRFRQKGDIFEKFGGGTKSLNDFFIDKKVPLRLRDHTPVLAVDNNVLVVAGVEISKKLKLDDTTKSAYGINVVKFL